MENLCLVVSGTIFHVAFLRKCATEKQHYSDKFILERNARTHFRRYFVLFFSCVYFGSCAQKHKNYAAQTLNTSKCSYGKIVYLAVRKVENAENFFSPEWFLMIKS